MSIYFFFRFKNCKKKKRKKYKFVPQMCIYCCPSNSVSNIPLQNGQYNAIHANIQEKMYHVEYSFFTILKKLFVFPKNHTTFIEFNINSILIKNKKIRKKTAPIPKIRLISNENRKGNGPLPNHARRHRGGHQD